MSVIQTQSQTSQKTSPISIHDSGVCAKTQKPLWEEDSLGAIHFLEPHGKCQECDRWYHIDQMKTNTTHLYPYRFSGLYCLTCYGRPLSKNDPFSKIKLIGE
jgi:hypothetical protein